MLGFLILFLTGLIVFTDAFGPTKRKVCQKQPISCEHTLKYEYVSILKHM